MNDLIIWSFLLFTRIMDQEAQRPYRDKLFQESLEAQREGELKNDSQRLVESFWRQFTDDELFLVQLQEDAYDLMMTLNQLELNEHLLANLCSHVGQVPVANPYTSYIRLQTDSWIQQTYIWRNRLLRMLGHARKQFGRACDMARVAELRAIEGELRSWFASQDFSRIRNWHVHEASYVSDEAYVVWLLEHGRQDPDRAARKRQLGLARSMGARRSRLIEASNEAILEKTASICGAMPKILASMPVVQAMDARIGERRRRLRRRPLWARLVRHRRSRGGR